MLLRPSLDVEKLGRRQNPCTYDGFRRRDLFRSREETKKEVTTGLPRRQPEASQLVGLQILLLRVTGVPQRCR